MGTIGRYRLCYNVCLYTVCTTRSNHICAIFLCGGRWERYRALDPHDLPSAATRSTHRPPWTEPTVPRRRPRLRERLVEPRPFVSPQAFPSPQGLGTRAGSGAHQRRCWCLQGTLRPSAPSATWRPCSRTSTVAQSPWDSQQHHFCLRRTAVRANTGAQSGQRQDRKVDKFGKRRCGGDLRSLPTTGAARTIWARASGTKVAGNRRSCASVVKGDWVPPS